MYIKNSDKNKLNGIKSNLEKFLQQPKCRETFIMKKKFGILTLALCLMLGAVGCSNNSSSSNASSAASSSGDSSEKVELNISAAASLQEAMVD